MDPLRYICNIPKYGFYPSENMAYSHHSYGNIQNKNLNKKYGVGEFCMVHDHNQKPYVRNNGTYTDIIKKGYWIYINKGGNIVESGTYADNNKKFGTWTVYFGGTKDLKDRINCETNYINDKIVGIQKIYKKTKSGKSVYLFREIEYDESGKLTGNTTKYNESGEIIAKTFRNDDIIIQEKYNDKGKIIVHREFNLSGKPINLWYYTKPKQPIYIWIYNMLYEYYKEDFEKKFPIKEDYKDYQGYLERRKHIFSKMVDHTYNSSFPISIRYTQLHITENDKEYAIFNFYDSEDNHLCEIAGEKTKYNEMYKYRKCLYR